MVGQNGKSFIGTQHKGIVMDRQDGTGPTTSSRLSGKGEKTRRLLLVGLFVVLSWAMNLAGCQGPESQTGCGLITLDFSQPDPLVNDAEERPTGPLIFSSEKKNLSYFRGMGHNAEFKIINRGLNLVLWSAGSPVWIPTNCAATSYNVVEITLKLDADTRADQELDDQSASQKRINDQEVGLRFSWKTEGQSEFSPYQSLSQKIIASRNEWRTYLFTIGENPFWQGHISGVALTVLSKNQRLVISSLSLSTQTLESDIDQSEKRFSTYGQSRSGTLVNVPSSYEQTVYVPEKSHLHFGMLLINNSAATCPGPVKVSISASSGITNKLSYTKTLRENKGLQPNDWVDVAVDLHTLQGQMVTFRWQIEGIAEHPAAFSDIYLALSTPFIRSRECEDNPSRVVLISIDTLRADHLGCYGYPVSTSPYIDLLSKQGILCHNAITPFPSTAPAHASLFTGLYPLQHEVFRQKNKLDYFTPTLTEFLKDQGFFTGAVTGNAFVSATYRMDKGFHFFDEREASIRSLTKSFIPLLRKNYMSSFFLFYHTYEVHGPYTYYKPLSDYYIASLEQHGPLPVGIKATKATFQKTDHPKNNELMIGLYDSSIRVTDNSIGRLFKVMRQLDIYDKTLIVFLSDHGEHFGEHHLYGHGNSVYAPLIDIPVLFRLPGQKHSGRIVSPFINLVDIAPTMCSFLGYKDKFNGPGRDLSALLNDKPITADLAFSYVEQKPDKLPRHMGQRVKSDGSAQSAERALEKFAVISPDHKFIKSGRRGEDNELYRIPSQETADDNVAPQLREQVQWFESQLDQHLNLYQEDKTDGALEGESEMDPNTEATLKALGYIL